MLEVKELTVNYGMIEALKRISIRVEDHKITTLIGSNGAGKTTTLHAISGLLKPKSGQIVLNKQIINNLPAHKIVELGIAQVPEGRRVFSLETVEENLELGAYARKDRAAVSSDLDYIYNLFPRLQERKKQLAGTLSGGEQQMLAMGRALLSRPKILLLDEPSMGLSPLLVKEVFKLIEKIKESGVTILLVEQNAKMALSVADRAYVLENGIITIEGSGQELLNSEQIKKAYLGL